MKMYQSKRNGNFAKMGQSDNEGKVILTDLQNGDVKEISESTLSRWWTPVEVVDVEETVAEEVVENVEPEAVVEEEAVEQVEPEASPLAEEEIPVNVEQTEEAQDEKPKKQKLIDIIKDTVEEMGFEILPKNDSQSWVTTNTGVKLVFVSPTLIATKEKLVKKVGLEYEMKGYNHPFKAKITLPETEEGIKETIKTLLA